MNLGHFIFFLFRSWRSGLGSLREARIVDRPIEDGVVLVHHRRFVGVVLLVLNVTIRH
jgi:hypothetical protein